MSNQEHPEGWTERMQPLPNDQTPTPQFGGVDGSRMNAPAPQGGAPANTPPAGQPPVQTDPGDPTTSMTQGEKYWYEQAMSSRELYSKVAPLAPFVDVITYLDANPAATELIMGHMRETSGQNPAGGEVNVNVDGQGNAGVQPNAGPSNVATPQMGGNQSMNSDMATELRKQHMEMLKKQGIPEHEADIYVQWLMNPGQLAPEDLFHMYKSLRAKNGQPIGANPNPVPNQNQPAQHGSPQSPAATGAVNPEIPPMSVAGMNGGTTDPRMEDEIKRRAQTRTYLDPNLA